MIKIETWASLEALAERADFLDGFFKVVMKIVDKNKFPIFFDDLYLKGDVSIEKLPSLLTEIISIENHLKATPVDYSCIGNEPDFSKVQNLDKFLNKSAKSMAEYFLTPNLENMTDVLKYYVGYAIRKETPLTVKYYST